LRRPIALSLLNGVVNPLVRGVLRSPAHRLVSGSLLVIELVGAKSGRDLAVPVAYEQTSSSELRVHVGGWQHKEWWRNLREPKPVTMWLRGNRVAGTGLVKEVDGHIDVLLELDH
jgi:hypothetical protein